MLLHNIIKYSLQTKSNSLSNSQSPNKLVLVDDKKSALSGIKYRPSLVDSNLFFFLVAKSCKSPDNVCLPFYIRAATPNDLSILSTLLQESSHFSKTFSPNSQLIDFLFQYQEKLHSPMGHFNLQCFYSPYFSN